MSLMFGSFFKKFLSTSTSMEHDLVVLDDMFPHLLSAFRITEYNALLQHFSKAAVYSNAVTFGALGEFRNFEEVFSEYAELYPKESGKVHLFEKNIKISARLCYLMFLNNANMFFEYLSKNNLPFVLELYPGGGFHLNDEESDKKLRKIVTSSLLQKIIVTQKISYDYLVNNFCNPNQVKLIYGGVFSHDRLGLSTIPRKLFPADKDTLDICFVAHKYMPNGRDKGYDIFIETASILAPLHPEITFHVVGPYCPEDIPVVHLGNRIRFYGSQTTEFFQEFYDRMDLILSPNTPFVLRPGAFDGFPTGACIEAAMCGVAVLCCDELKMNPFVDGEELVIIPRDPLQISAVISSFFKHPEQLYRIAKNGKQRFRNVFSLKEQIEPRIKVLEECMSKGGMMP